MTRKDRIPSKRNIFSSTRKEERLAARAERRKRDKKCDWKERVAGDHNLALLMKERKEQIALNRYSCDRNEYQKERDLAVRNEWLDRLLGGTRICPVCQKLKPLSSQWVIIRGECLVKKEKMLTLTDENGETVDIIKARKRLERKARGGSDRGIWDYYPEAKAVCRGCHNKLTHKGSYETSVVKTVAKVTIDADWLVSEREKLGVSQRKFAQLAGWSRAWQYKLESGFLKSVDREVQDKIKQVILSVSGT
jgi:hypothetical protein